jgi:hypothetical protein
MESRIKYSLRMRGSTVELKSFQDALNDQAQALGDMTGADGLLPDYWAQRRRRPGPADRALTGQTLEWLMKLPSAVQPHEMVDRFPRVVNRIAAAWADPRAGHDLLHDLLHDQRPGRKGFPAPVKRELKILRFHHVNTLASCETAAKA